MRLVNKTPLSWDINATIIVYKPFFMHEATVNKWQKREKSEKWLRCVDTKERGEKVMNGERNDKTGRL